MRNDEGVLETLAKPVHILGCGIHESGSDLGASRDELREAESSALTGCYGPHPLNSSGQVSNQWCSSICKQAGSCRWSYYWQKPKPSTRTLTVRERERSSLRHKVLGHNSSMGSRRLGG